MLIYTTFIILTFLSVAYIVYIYKSIKTIHQENLLTRIDLQDTKKRILIVDGDTNSPDILKLKEFSITRGYETLIAQNGIEAFKIIGKKKPDIILSELVMPQMDGMELLYNVKTKYPDIVFITMTAHATVKTAEEALKKGAYDFIVKPIKLNEIFATIERAIELKSLERRIEELNEKIYKMRIETNPKETLTFVSYADFLRNIKDYDKAEMYYKRAIEVVPQDALILNRYADFLKNVRKDDDKAAMYYQRALIETKSLP